MSNFISLVSCKFTDTDGAETYGFRIYDDYSKDYDNNSGSLITDDLNLLEYAVSVVTDQGRSIIEWLKIEQCGITINGTYFEYEQIKQLL